MPINFQIENSKPVLVIKNNPLQFENVDIVDCKVNLNPGEFTNTDLPVTVKAGKTKTIPLNGSRSTGKFEITVVEKIDSKKESKKSKKPKDDQVMPRMIIKVE